MLPQPKHGVKISSAGSVHLKICRIISKINSFHRHIESYTYKIYTLVFAIIVNKRFACLTLVIGIRLQKLSCFELIAPGKFLDNEDHRKMNR